MHTLACVSKLGACRYVKTEMKRRGGGRKMGLSGKRYNLLMSYEADCEKIQSQQVCGRLITREETLGKSLKLETGIVRGKRPKQSHFLGKLHL